MFYVEKNLFKQLIQMMRVIKKPKKNLRSIC